MKKWITLLAIPALCAGGLSARAIQDDAKRDQERARVEREIQELEAQRAKIDSRLRELRRQSGRSARISPRIRVNEDLSRLSPEEREKVERALEKARAAVEEATKNLPDFNLVIPDVDALTDKVLRIYKDKDGKITRESEMTPEQRDQFLKSMQKMREDLRRIGPEIRARMLRDGALKEHLKGLKELRGLKDDELKGLRDLRAPDREEIRRTLEEARREMERAREEMRKAHEEMRRELREEREKGARDRERERDRSRERPESENRGNIEPA